MSIQAEEKRATASEVARRNFAAWVAHQTLYRIGWQFKMEATMIAGLVSFLSPSGRIIGMFSTSGSVGRCLGPLLATPWVDRSPSKKRCLLWLWAAMLLCWAVAALFLWSPLALDKRRTLWWFFCWYTAFFTFLGCAGVAQGALLGKIIPVDRRGRALSLTHAFAGPINLVAILIVYGLVRSGSFPAPRNYALAFTVTTLLFALAGLAVLLAQEKPSRLAGASTGFRARMQRAGHLLRNNRDFRVFIWVQFAIGLGETALPFYTAYGRHAGSIRESSIILATILQVAFQAIASSWLGRVADRRGNRIIICWLVWAQAATPVTAILAASFFPGTAAFLVVYCMVGARFPIFQILVNYLLEIVPEEEHALALGTSNALPLFTVGTPLLFGALCDGAGYAVGMGVAAAVLGCAAVGAQFLREPREFGAGGGEGVQTCGTAARVGP